MRISDWSSDVCSSDLFSAFDTERVEILRGPQGTLYGRNATGGTVNYITKKPSQDFEGNADVTIGNYDMWRLRSAVNIPVSGGTNTRFVGERKSTRRTSRHQCTTRKQYSD